MTLRLPALTISWRAFLFGADSKKGGSKALDFESSAYFALLHRRQRCFWSVLEARLRSANFIAITWGPMFERRRQAEMLPFFVEVRESLKLDDVYSLFRGQNITFSIVVRS